MMTYTLSTNISVYQVKDVESGIILKKSGSNELINEAWNTDIK